MVQSLSGKLLAFTSEPVRSSLSIHRVTEAGISQVYCGTDGCCARHYHMIEAAAVDPVLGRLYVGDGNSVGAVQDSGCVETIAGKQDEHGDVDGTGGDARFFTPHGIAFGPDGRMLVSDMIAGKLRLLTRTPAGWQVKSIPDPDELMHEPAGVTYSHALGAFLVCSYGNHRVVKVSENNDAGYTIQPFAGNG
jgi:hypothetical protein